MEAETLGIPDAVDRHSTCLEIHGCKNRCGLLGSLFIRIRSYDGVEKDKRIGSESGRGEQQKVGIPTFEFSDTPGLRHRSFRFDRCFLIKTWRS